MTPAARVESDLSKALHDADVALQDAKQFGDDPKLVNELRHDLSTLITLEARLAYVRTEGLQGAD